MTGVNYISGSLNRSKAKIKHPSTDGPTRPRLRGQPLFARPAPTLLQVDKGKPVLYRDPAIPPRTSQNHDNSDDRSTVDAYSTLPAHPTDLTVMGGPDGKSGVYGIAYPWAQSCRNLYLEEMAVQKWNSNRRFRRSDDEEDGEEGQMKRSIWVHRASRAKRGEERRGRRRWWDTRVLDLITEEDGQQRFSCKENRALRDTGGRGVSADEHEADRDDEADTGEGADNAQRRTRQDCADPQPSEISFNRELPGEDAWGDVSGLDDVAAPPELPNPCTRSSRPNLDRERHVLSALIGQYDFLQIHGLQTSSTIANDDGLSGIPASSCLTDQVLYSLGGISMLCSAEHFPHSARSILQICIAPDHDFTTGTTDIRFLNGSENRDSQGKMRDGRIGLDFD